MEVETLKEVAARIKMGKSTIRKKYSEGTFPRPISLGKRVKVWRKSDIDAWLEQQFSNA